MSPTITGISSPPRFTRYELAYLLAGREDASAQTSREVFGIPAVGPDDAGVLAGASSLVARGLIEQDQENVLPRNEAGLVGFALGTAQQWISLVIRVPEGTDVLVFVEGRGAAFMVRGAPADTLDFVPVQPGTPAREVARDAISRVLARSDADLMIRVAGVDEQSALFVRVRPEGLGIGRDPVFPGSGEWPAEDLEITEASRADADAAIASLLGFAS